MEPLVAAIIVLSIIIFVHELGHFILAKLNHVTVIEFSLGFGPRIITHVSRKSGTRYSIKIILFGGSCAMLGEQPDEDSEETADLPENLDLTGNFTAKSPLARISIMAAGPFFHFFLAFFCAIAIIAWAGYDPPDIVGVLEGYPAEEAGIRAGDVVTKIGNKHVGTARDITYSMMGNAGESVKITVKRYDDSSGKWDKISTTINPKYSEEDGSYLLGVQWSGYRVPAANIFEILKYAVYEVHTDIMSVIDSLELLIKGRVGADDLAGPVRIVSMIGESDEYNRQYGTVTVIMNLINMMTLFSANLGVMNLIPFPALDGGQIVLTLWELITGKPVKPKIANTINFIGMALLMTLMIYLVFHDIGFLIGG